MDLVLLYFIPNIAIVWNMISFVEGLARNQGGLGDRQLVAERFISFDTVWAIALVTLSIGLLTAFSVFAVRWFLFPYTRNQETRKD
jgi:ABC-type nitrate/sulfonate/bicarbonate transport system permease component